MSHTVTFKNRKKLWKLNIFVNQYLLVVESTFLISSGLGTQFVFPPLQKKKTNKPWNGKEIVAKHENTILGLALESYLNNQVLF